MYFFDNPVLQRELLVNLRMPRAFLLLFLYQAMLGTIVLLAWPQETRLEPNTEGALLLVDMFFLSQYVLASLMAPSFAAGAISGEKERATYEMLLASPLRPGAIVTGKLFAALGHLGVLIFSSLPIVMLCLPLGGVSLYEVLAAYLWLILSVLMFGMISLACSSFFSRTSASLVVSYLLILPPVLLAAVTWRALGNYGDTRLFLALTFMPAGALVVIVALFFWMRARLLYPPDVGSEGKDVVDIEHESSRVVGLVIRPDQFPDRLFAPAKRTDLIDDGANPVYDKEVRSELFSQGTLMLRVVIQVSMLLAIPIMAACLFIVPAWAPWYIGYVLVFNMLVGPVFSAGSITSERERETFDLLLTTDITPWQILSGKLLAGLRVSSVLTLFLVWPLVLACAMVSAYYDPQNLLAAALYIAIILLTCLTTAQIALFSSVINHTTRNSLMVTYLLILMLFGAPPMARAFVEVFYPDREELKVVEWLNVSSPFAAAAAVPRNMTATRIAVDDYYSYRSHFEKESAGGELMLSGSWAITLGYFAFTMLLNAALFLGMVGMFHRRWRVAQ